MDVRHCPKCGSGEIDTRSSSFEYGGSTTWSCEDCEWYYTKGRGIGTGTGNSGTHPRELSSGSQATLTEVGEYCSNCDTVLKGDHACTPEEIVTEADEPLNKEEVIDRLEEFHFNGEKELKEAIKNRKIALTPTFYQVVDWPDDGEPAMVDEVREEIHRIIEEKPDDPDGYRNRGDRAKTSTLKERLAAQTPTESVFIDQCITHLERHDGLVRTMEGVFFRDLEDELR